MVEKDVWLEGGREYILHSRVGTCGVDVKSNGEGIFYPDRNGLAQKEIIAACSLVKMTDGYSPIRIFNLSSSRICLHKDTCLCHGDLVSSINGCANRLRSINTLWQQKSEVNSMPMSNSKMTLNE